MKFCMVIRGWTSKNKPFRPATPSPDKNWVYMFMGRFHKVTGAEIVWVDGEPCIGITRALKDIDESAFEEISEFACGNDLEISTNVNECEKCTKHRACPSIRG